MGSALGLRGIGAAYAHTRRCRQRGRCARSDGGVLVTVQVIANVITIAGQLYVAILIALVLGRVQKRLT